VVVVFDTAADAQGFATHLESTGLLDASAQIMVGGNWTVNTEAPLFRPADEGDIMTR
jgi:hypothetical protein